MVVDDENDGLDDECLMGDDDQNDGVDNKFLMRGS